MSRVYRQFGNVFFPSSHEQVAVCETLPAGNYTVKFSKQEGFYLERMADFELPKKLYGDVNTQAMRILTTFLSRPGSTGVLLAGQKGAGKTMLTKRLAQLAAAEYGIPTLVVNEAFCGEAFNAFIGNMNQPAIVLIDEFEKTYDRETQPSLLTLLDGLYTSQKLFLLTCNDRYRVDTNMINRPGRLFYSLDFTGLSQDFIKEYCDDNLANKANLRGVQSVAAFFSEFSFDMLQALVEEMNRYGETATDAMRMLNMRPQNDDGASYDVHCLRHGVRVVSDGQSHDTVSGSPLSLNGMELTLYAFDPGEGPEDGLREVERYTLDLNKLTLVDVNSGHFEFATHDPAVTVQFIRRRPRRATVDYDRLAA